MKNKNEIKEIILSEENDIKELKIKIGEFSSKKLVSILKKLLENTYQFKKIRINREYVEIENVKYISGEPCLVFETNKEKEVFAIYLGEDENKLLKQVLIVFNIQANKLVPTKINILSNEDKYLIGGDSYRLNGFIVNGEVVLKENISLFTIDLRLAYWKYNRKIIKLEGIFLENVSKNEIILQELNSFSVVVDENGAAYNQFLYKNSYLLFPIMVSGAYEDELENYSNIGYYLYHSYMTYMENEQKGN